MSRPDLDALEKLAGRIKSAGDDRRYPRFSDMEAASDGLTALIAELKEAREKLADLLDEAEDVFVCMADATGISRHNFPPPYVKARAFLARNGKGEG